MICVGLLFLALFVYLCLYVAHWYVAHWCVCICILFYSSLYVADFYVFMLV